MNAPRELNQLSGPSFLGMATADDSPDKVHIAEYWDIVLDCRWLIAVVAALCVGFGAAYAFFASPVYETNLLIQVEDSSSSAKSFLGEAASLFDIKTPAVAEIEILRSRMILGRAVESTKLYIEASPQYLPIVGKWLARRADSLSTPTIFGWVAGNERIKVGLLDVPSSFEDTSFEVTALGNGRFQLAHDNLENSATGVVNETLVVSTPDGDIRILISELNGKPGAQFSIVRRSDIDTIDWLQEKLKLSERGRQSGIIDATLQHTDPIRLVSLLNEIGKQYVNQNVDRKAAEAQKTLNFLDVQLPQFKRQLEVSEDAYSKYRNRQGAVALDEEAKLVLARVVEVQGKLAEVRQKRLEMISKFRPEHPNIITLDAQIVEWNRELASLDARIKAFPAVQQDALRLERDVKVNNELYQQLKNNALQLQLIREGKIGNVRVIDAARLPKEPVKPKKAVVIIFSLLVGLLIGLLIAIVRNALFRGVKNAQEIEAHVGVNVYSTIPLSRAQQDIARKVEAKLPGMNVLAHVAPQDSAVESLRSLRTALQFAMLESTNNRILITGATPGVGKSFISANFAAIMASAGKRVLLIDADLRKGHLNNYFGLERTAGLSEVIAGALSLERAVHKEVLPKFDFIATGVLPPNPAELLASGTFAALLNQLSSEYDIVIIDCPPVLVAADTLSICSLVGTVLVVARAAQTQVGELNECVRRIGRAGMKVSGILFNALDVNRRHAGRYGYQYGAYQYKQYRYSPADEKASSSS